MMKNIDIINGLIDNGQLDQLIKGGLFPVTIKKHVEINNYVKTKMSTGQTKSAAVIMANEMFGLSERQIYKILKSLS